MFEILRKSLATGIVTTAYPGKPAEVSIHARGRPEIEFGDWKDARPATAACPTGALVCTETGSERRVVLDALRQRGVLTLDVPANQLSLSVINRYLELKGRMQL